MSDTGPVLDPREQMLVNQANKAAQSTTANQAAAQAKKEAEAAKKAEAEKRRKTRQAKQTERRAARAARWEQTFAQQYPQYAWMFTELDRTKYADVFDLFNKAVDPKNDYTPERFQQEFAGSSWFREIQSSNKLQEIKSSVGTLEWDPGTLSKFVTRAVGQAWTGDQLAQEAYKEVFQKGFDGKYVNQVAVDQVRKTAPYLQYKNTARAYFTTLPDDRIERVLKGEVTQEDVLSGLREATKLKYNHLSTAIDAGQTLEDLAADYKKTAADLLERDMNDIDMTLPDFEVALAYTDGGAKRMLTTGEWAKLLRTDKRYGWNRTEQARQIGSDIATTIVQQFQRGF
jgi:hypothetical protein